MLGHDIILSRKTPTEWCDVLGLQILDNDGFPEWEAEYYLDEFVTRYRMCTVNPDCQKVLRETYNDIKHVHIYFEGSGDPEKNHDIIGLVMIKADQTSLGLGRIPEVGSYEEI